MAPLRQAPNGNRAASNVELKTMRSIDDDGDVVLYLLLRSSKIDDDVPNAGLGDGDARGEMLEGPAAVAEAADLLVSHVISIRQKHKVALCVAIELDDLAFVQVAALVQKSHLRAAIPR